jgi:Na+-dependent transporters of the SNF family
MTKHNQHKDREKFGSSFGVLVALAGSAVGLGNIWRFPYLVGQDGGAAFIILYLLFVVLICMPIMCSEFIIGRRSQANTVTAYKRLAPGSKWYLVGLLSVITPFIILSFYSVVGGWSIQYLFKACSLEFTTEPKPDFGALFNDFTTSTWQPVIYHFIFLALTAIIVMKGVKKGIEKFSKVMMPLLFFLMIIIAIRAITMTGAGEGLKYLFKPDFSKLNSRVALDALGQAFFSLSLGMGAVITYGSYTRKDANILRLSSLTAVSDTVFALISGCAIMPAVFAFGMSPSQGPGLVFVVLPQIFASMPLGGLVAIIFFFSLLLAALSSSISLLEVVTAFMVEEWKMKRKTAVLTAFVVFFLLGAVCSLSIGPWADFKIFGLNVFDLFDKVSSNIFMMLGALFIVLFVGWKLGKVAAEDELTNQGSLKLPRPLVNVLMFIIKYIAPLVILIIAVGNFL